MSKKNYKTHMIKIALWDYYSGGGDEAITYCGLNSDDATEDFSEHGSFVDNIDKCTCFNCIKSYYRELSKVDNYEFYLEEKAWLVAAIDEMPSIKLFGDPNEDHSMVVYSDNRNQARSKASQWSVHDYTELCAIRFNAKDKVFYQGRIVTRDQFDCIVSNNKAMNKWRCDMKIFILKHAGQQVRIWSGEHRAYWGPNSGGYHTDGLKAGIYDIDDAWDRVKHCGPEKKISFRLVSE